MSKHNKKRNTAFIYEALVREVVKQSIANNKEKRNLAISLLKEFFNKNTLLYKDLQLYKSILETKDVKEQSKIIKKINKQLSPEVFMNYVPTYKYLASIGMFFGDNLNPKQKVLLEEKILENMTLAKNKINIKEKKSVDNLVVKSFVKRFNDTTNKQKINESFILKIAQIQELAKEIQTND